MKNKYAFSSSKKLVSKGMSLAALRNSGLTFAVAFTLLATGCSKDTPVMKKSQLESAAATVKVVAAVIPLNTAAAYTIFSETGVTATAGSTVQGNIGVGPIASTAVTGFGLVVDAKTHQFSVSTGGTVQSKVYGPDYAAPTPANIALATIDMENTYNKASQLITAKHMYVLAAELSGTTLTPGTYKAAAALLISAGGVVKFHGAGVYTIQVGSALTVGSGVKIVLENGATAANINWVTGTAATFGTDVTFYGNILAKTAVTLNTDDVITGKIFAQTAVTMTGSTVKPE